MRVCLIRPPVLTAPASLSYYGAVPDLGLAYVAAAVRAAGHDVQVIDGPGAAPTRRRRVDTEVGTLVAHGLSPREIAERIDPRAEVIGFAHMFLHEWPSLRGLVSEVRAHFPDALLVAGGENASAFWPHMLAQAPALDVCVRGEGEPPMLALLDRLAHGGDLVQSPSLALRVAGRPHATERAPRWRELDRGPWPAWDLFPVAAYLAHGRASGVDRGPALPVLTSRGCPYRCTFCSSPQMWTTRYVRRDPVRVVDEIEHLVRTYGITSINLNDLTALLTKAWILEFAAALRARELHVAWQLPSGTRSEAIDREAAAAMAAAGCTNLCYAPESGSPPELTRMKKRVDPERLLRSVRDASELGIATHASIIVGMPEQDFGDVRRTARYIARLARAGLHSLSVIVFAPYPGSEAYAQLEAAGRIVIDEAYVYGSLLRSAGGTRSVHPRWSRRRLLTTQLGLLGWFFAVQYATRPTRLVHTVAAVARGRQHTVLEQLVAAKLRDLGESRPGRLLRSMRGRMGSALRAVTGRLAAFSVLGTRA